MAPFSTSPSVPKPLSLLINHYFCYNEFIIINKLFLSCVSCAMLYGSETWPTKIEDIRKNAEGVK